jgi:hypothetical protein
MRGVIRMIGMLTRSCGLAGMKEGDEEPFLRAFLLGYDGGRHAEKACLWLDELRAMQRGLNLRRARSRTRRCVKRSTMFTRERCAGLVVHRRRDFPLESALVAVERHSRAVARQDGGGQILHAARRSAVSLCACPGVPPIKVDRPSAPEELQPGVVCVKSFDRPSLRDRLKDLLRPKSRARASWIASHGMRVRGLPVASPLAVLESRGKLAGHPDYLIAEALENDGTLGDLSYEPLSPAQRRGLCEATGQLLRRLADRQVYHPDTKPRNFLVKETDDGYRLWLVDPDRIRFEQAYSRVLWVKVLGRVNAGLASNVTLLDRMRCLRLCGRGRWTPEERLSIARAAYELSLTRRPAWLAQGPSGRSGEVV